MGDLGGSTPSQYSLPEGVKELQDLIEYKKMNFALGNIFKAVYRMGSCNHASKEYDLNKIIWFANRELDRIRKDTHPAVNQTYLINPVGIVKLKSPFKES